MERVPEPELMQGHAQAAAYAAADFAVVNQAFVDALLAAFPGLAGRIVDLGCGPADIAIRIVRTLPRVRVVGVDGSAAMLAHARSAVERAGVRDRVSLVCGAIPGAVGGPFDGVVSNRRRR